MVYILESNESFCALKWLGVGELGTSRVSNTVPNYVIEAGANCGAKCGAGNRALLKDYRFELLIGHIGIPPADPALHPLCATSVRSGCGLRDHRGTFVQGGFLR